MTPNYIWTPSPSLFNANAANWREKEKSVNTNYIKHIKSKGEKKKFNQPIKPLPNINLKGFKERRKKNKLKRRTTRSGKLFSGKQASKKFNQKKIQKLFNKLSNAVSKSKYY